MSKMRREVPAGRQLRPNPSLAPSVRLTDTIEIESGHMTKASHRTGCEATEPTGSVVFDLLNRTTSSGEGIIRIGTDEPDSANYEH